jgi:hypothetical protein
MWRWAGVDDPESGDSAEGTLSHPVFETINVENDGVADDGTENNARRSESEPRLVTNIYERVRILESDVIKIKTVMQSSISHEREKCGRMLSFAKHELGMELN